MPKYKVVPIIITLIFTIALLTWISYSLKNTVAGPPDTLKADVYFAFNFVPQFKYEECSALVLMGDNATDDSARDYFDHLHRYLMRFEPRTMYVGSGRILGQETDQYEVLFANECHRQIDILRNAQDNFLSNSPNLKIKILSNPDPSRIDPISGPFWTNSIDYDPELWRLKRLAMGTCDPNRWQALATYLEHEHDKFNSHQIVGVYLYLSTAKALGNNSQSLIEKINQIRIDYGIKDVDQFQKMIREFMKMNKC